MSTWLDMSDKTIFSLSVSKERFLVLWSKGIPVLLVMVYSFFIPVIETVSVLWEIYCGYKPVGPGAGWSARPKPADGTVVWAIVDGDWKGEVEWKCRVGRTPTLSSDVIKGWTSFFYIPCIWHNDYETM